MYTVKANILKRLNFLGGERFVVEAVWSANDGTPIDRPNTYAICVSLYDTAERLARAINAQVIFKNPILITDCYKKTYIQADCNVHGLYLESDLKNYGF